MTGFILIALGILCLAIIYFMTQSNEEKSKSKNATLDYKPIDEAIASMKQKKLEEDFKLFIETQNKKKQKEIVKQDADYCNILSTANKQDDVQPFYVYNHIQKKTNDYLVWHALGNGVNTLTSKEYLSQGIFSNEKIHKAEINETEVTVLKKNIDSGEIFIDFVKIDRVLDSYYDAFLSQVESVDYTARDISNIVKNHTKLRAILYKIDYCVILDRPWENGMPDLSLSFGEQYPILYPEIGSSIDSKKQDINMLLQDLRTRLAAYYLNLTCKNCEDLLERGEILAYSHRKVGWSNPEYNPFDDNFSIEIKTNFGYGASSYFYTLIKYKNINITPFSDWVLYGYARSYEIVTYTSKHPLCNESWLDTMEYVCNAYNLYLRDELSFIQKYIIEECERMVAGIESFLNGNQFQFLDWQRFRLAEEKEKTINENKETTDSKFHYLTWRRYLVNREFEGRSLIEFRASKISGALTFIEHILKLSNVIDVKNFVTRIENCCNTLNPILASELTSIASELETQNKIKNDLKPKFDKLLKRKTVFDIQVEKFSENLKQSGQYSAAFLVMDNIAKKFAEQNPTYAEFRKDFDRVYKEYHNLASKIQSLETIQSKIANYHRNINLYFKNQLQLN